MTNGQDLLKNYLVGHCVLKDFALNIKIVYNIENDVNN